MERMQLGGADDTRREAAVARLAVIGARAAEHLLREFSSAAPGRARAGMLQALDASGGIGVTERTAYILRVRQLAVAIAKFWVGEREKA